MKIDLLKQAELRSNLINKIQEIQTCYIPEEFDVIISVCEINSRHGVGFLLQRIFANSQDILSLRSLNLYDGQQAFGRYHCCMELLDYSPGNVQAKLSEIFKKRCPRRILSIPYSRNDVLISLALKEMFDVPLLTYIMDDQNIYVKSIPDDELRLLIKKSQLCLGISQEMCQAYEDKYNHKFWFVPPVVEEKLIAKTLRIPQESLEQKRGVIIGNIWSQEWLDRLRLVTRQADVHLDWYGNPNRDWVLFDETTLAQDGIHFQGYCQEEQLIKILQNAPYAIVPTGSGNSETERVELTRLSLPSRIPYIVTTSHTPIIVVGTAESAAAKFVEKFQLGRVCPYEAKALRKAIDLICTTTSQEQIRNKQAKLAKNLSARDMAKWLWDSLAKGEPIDNRFDNLESKLTSATALITANEVTHKHGTGVLVKRIIGDTPEIFSIRSINHYEGDHSFGDVSFCLPQKGVSRLEAFQNVIQIVRGTTIKRIFCVPYHADELITAIALKELFNVPLGTYIMDDQNICVDHIPDDLMKEFLGKCSLRLATHPELKEAYEGKYNLSFWLLPAVAPSNLISTQICQVNHHRGALIGSIWSQNWFKMLLHALQGTNISLDWYGNSEYHWLKDSPATLREQGVNICGLVPEAELTNKLRNYSYIVVPTGTLDERDDHPELSRLSLPGRIIFALATANTPVIILGSEKTSAANFVNHFQVGIVCDYKPHAFREAVEWITQPATQQQIRSRAAALAQEFSAAQINEWLWRSLALGQPSDLRFENLFSQALRS